VISEPRLYITTELLGGGRTVRVSMLVSRNVELYITKWGAASASAWCLLPQRVCEL